MFKVGDKVWSEEFGVGGVKTTCGAHPLYSVVVDFVNQKGACFTLDGRWVVYQHSHPRNIVPYTGQDKEEAEAYSIAREELVPKYPPDCTARIPVDTEIYESIKEGLEDAIEQLTPTIADRLTEAASWDTEIPANVRRHLLGDMNATLAFHCTNRSEVSVGEADYASLDELREAVEWFVYQLGGTVKWEEK